MAHLHVETPTVELPAINAHTGRRVFLKMECYQPVGSFKLRGIGHFFSTMAAAGAKRFICSSGGNSGLAAAYAGWRLGCECIVVLPTSSKPHVLERLKAYGVKVIVHGSVWDDADAYARALCAEGGATYVSPFDHPLVWEGNATLVHEAHRQVEKPDLVVLAVGGGGLLCGTLQGMHDVSWGDVPLIGVETAGAASFAAAIQAGRPVPINEIATVATSLGARQVSAEAFEWTRRHDVRSAVVRDEDAIAAAAWFLDELRVRVEPACGTALALVHGRREFLGDARKVLVVVCGGAVI